MNLSHVSQTLNPDRDLTLLEEFYLDYSALRRTVETTNSGEATLAMLSALSHFADESNHLRLNFQAALEAYEQADRTPNAVRTRRAKKVFPIYFEKWRGGDS